MSISRRSILIFAIGFLFTHASRAEYESVLPFDPAECPASRCTLTEASYPFGRWTIRVIHAEAKPGIDMDSLPEDQWWGCRAWLELRGKGNRLKDRVFGAPIDAVGSGAGLFIPPQQPIPGLFLVAKDGDYESNVFVIHSDGTVDRALGTIQFYEPEHRLLFLGTNAAEAAGRVTILDGSRMQIVFEDSEIYPSNWYRLGKEIYFTGERGDGTPPRETSVGYFFDFARRTFHRRSLTPEDLAKATEITDGFDLRPLRNCHSPTVNQ